MKPVNKKNVKTIASYLMNKYGSTTAIDVKNRLRNIGYKAFQADISAWMEELSQEENWKKTHTHGNATYQFKSTSNPNIYIDVKKKYEQLFHKKIYACKTHYYNLILTEKQEAQFLIQNQKEAGYILSTKNIGCILNWPLPSSLNTLKDSLGAEQWNIQKFPKERISYSGQKIKKQEAFLNSKQPIQEYTLQAKSDEVQLMNLHVDNQNLAAVELTFDDESTVKLSKFEISLDKELKPLVIKLVKHQLDI